MDDVEVDDAAAMPISSSCRASSPATVLFPLAMGPVMTTMVKASRLYRRSLRNGHAMPRTIALWKTKIDGGPC